MKINMQKFHTIAVSCLCTLAALSISSAAADVSQAGYYHYPAPPSNRRYEPIARQLAAPALEHAAFTQALQRFGFDYNSGSSLPASAAITAASSSARADSNSLNIKLPVPFGVTPLNIAQLPLQAGAPYSELPHVTGINSYGTLQPQRR